MDCPLIITAILGLILIYLFYILANKNMDYWKIRGVPQWTTYPLLGSMGQLLAGKMSMVDLSNQIYKDGEGKKYVGFMMFQKPILQIRDIDLINQVLIKDFSHFQDRFLPVNDDADLLNASMSNVTGDRWRVLRHKLTPTFTSGKMKMMFNHIKECSDELVLYLKKKNGTDLEVRSYVFRFVLNVIGKISFGVSVDALNEKIDNENEFYQNSKKFFEPSFWLQIKFLLFSTAPKLKEKLGIKFVDGKVNQFFQKLTQDLIEYREKGGGGIKRNDFLQLMLEQKNKERSLLLGNSFTNTDSVNKVPEDADEPEDIELLDHLKNVKYDKNATVFTDQIIAGQTFIFISGGSETVSAALSFALYYLATNKDVQKRLQKEVEDIVENNGFNYDSVRKMTYLDQVIYEVLRLRPPGGLLSRLCTEEYKLPGTDVVVEKGGFIHVPVQAIHKDPQYFPEPEKFNPDRFEDMEAIPKGVYFPFGGGPRICIAMRLAMLEMKIFLATIATSFNVVLSEKTQLPLVLNKKSILQHVIGGIWVRFEPRTK